MVLVTAYCVAIDTPAGVAPALDAAQVKARSEKKPVDPWAHIEDAGQINAAKKPADTWAGMKDVAKKREDLLP
ncbi:hypothetical protein [Parasphingorhabdus sp.]|uniref:hypothetical protein n=1 Tax=Parasphingorhabdus sp. TaxID=2709688 RepID=UPI0030A0FCAF|nr:hypothetical protein [Sphingomonadales bacterium]